jgi:hypothetical protein
LIHPDDFAHRDLATKNAKMHENGEDRLPRTAAAKMMVSLFVVYRVFRGR